MTNEVPSKGLEWTNLVLGAGLACAAFAFTEMPAAAWNAGIVGALIACCSAMALYRYGAWTEWSNLGLGCWGVAAPFLLGFGSAQAAMWTHVSVGLASRRSPSSSFRAAARRRCFPGPTSGNFMEAQAPGDGRAELFPRPSLRCFGGLRVKTRAASPNRQENRSWTP
jgi:hypothetical protein